MGQQAESMELDVYEMLQNTDPLSKGMGLQFTLAKPIRCKNMQEVSNLEFIYRNFTEGENELYFKYREDIGMHTVLISPPTNNDRVVIIALARFVEPAGDTKAVDLLVKG